MSDATPAVAPVPPGMHTVTPHLVCAGAEAAMAFYAQAFGAVPGGCLKAPDGRVLHAQMRLGDATVMLVDEWPEMGGLGPKALGIVSPVTLHLYVPDADAVFAQAVAAGCTVRMPLADMFWGDRYGHVECPWGHRWSIASHRRDVSVQEMQAAVAAMRPDSGCGA